VRWKASVRCLLVNAPFRHYPKERDGGKYLGAWTRHEDSLNRWKEALRKDPREWLGPDNDPDGPAYQARLNEVNRMMATELDAA
jgi:hypothetical protein